MGDIITYKNAGAAGVYSQIKLDNGERILISIAQPGVQVYKLGFMGLIPTGTIWKSSDLRRMAVLFGNDIQSESSLLDAIIRKRVGCVSIDEVRTLLSESIDAPRNLE
jgi:hypothetical protein